jgi:hypothetical protein
MVACEWGGFGWICLYFQSSKLGGVIWQISLRIVDAVPLVGIGLADLGHPAMLRFQVVTKGKYSKKKLRVTKRDGPQPSDHEAVKQHRVAVHKSSFNPRDDPAGKVTLLKVRSALWGLLCFVAGVLVGPVIQQSFFVSLPDSRTQSTLRAEIVRSPGEPDCHFYRVIFTNFEPIDYLHAKVQFPDPITSFKVGVPAETVLSDAQRAGTLNWGKGRDAQHKCFVQSDELSSNPNVQSSINGHMIEIQTSKLPDPTSVFALIATTSGIEPTRAKLWTEGEYEYSKFGLSIRKKLPIKIRTMTGAD